MRKTRIIGRAAVYSAALFYLVPGILSALAAQNKPAEKPQVVDMVSFKVSPPPGGKWDIEINEEGVRVIFSKSKGGGLLGALSPASQQRETAVVVSSIGLREDRWLMTEAEVVDDIIDDYVGFMSSGGNEPFKLVEKGNAEQKDKKLRFAKFHGTVQAVNDPSQYFTQDQLVYYYFPPDFRKTHRYFQFESIFSRAVSGLKLYQNPGSEPVFAVIDSLEIVSTLQAAPGLDGELIRAAEAGELEGARQALDKGAKPDASFGRATALSVAAFFGRRETIDLLLERGAGIDKGDEENGATPLFQAVMGLEPAIAGLLVERGADVNKKTKLGQSTLMLAAGSMQTEVVSMLVERGADVKAKDEEGLTPLMFAARSGSAGIAQLLIEKGAEIDAQSKDGTTALMKAIEMGKADVVKMLIERGPDINLKDKDGWTALWWAVNNGRTEIARMLIEKGADVNAKNKTGLTPLMRAAWTGEADVVKLLLEKGADVNAKADKNWTALRYAKKANNKEITRMLQAAGAK
jgi:ankyrin repeat protein